MQGVKIYQEKLFNSFQLSDRVPETNFYRRLKEVLHLDFLYDQTKKYYGESGQSSICLLYTSPSPRDRQKSRMPSSA